MSPTAPTIVTLNDQLNKAHRRIRELQARETELLAQNRTLCAVITELTDEDARTAAELCSSPLPTSSPMTVWQVRHRRARKLGPEYCGAITDTSEELRAGDPHPARAGSASKRGGRRMFDLDPIGAMFLIFAVLSLIAAAVYGRDDR